LSGVKFDGDAEVVNAALEASRPSRLLQW